MKEIKTEIEIDSTPERVWEVLADLSSYSEWNPFVTRAKGDLKLGERIEILVQVPGGRALKFTPRVLEVEPNRALRWLGTLLIPGLFNGEHIFRIEPLGEGRSRFLHGEKFTGLLIPFMGGTLEKVKKGYVLMNEALKTRVELRQRNPDPSYATAAQGEGRCPRCGEGSLRAWYELSEDEREVAKRLPASSEYSVDERMARHRWCVHCWHEEVVGNKETA